MALYQSPTLSSYNDDPPPDDGSLTSANRVTWAKIKNEIGDPLSTYAQAVNTAAASGFAAIADPLYLTDPAYSVVGDGVTDDTTGVQSAVSAAYAAGRPLYWPDGTYLVTGSIANLHSVRHRGPGVLKRGSNTFPVSPNSSDSNTLYVGTGGDDANDGITSALPFLTPSAAASAIENYGPFLDGSWTIQIAAGNYPGGILVPRSLRYRTFLKLKGANTSHPSVPTTEIRFADDPSATYGVFAQDGAFLEIEDIKFSGPFDQHVLAQRNCYLFFDNLHIDGHRSGFSTASAWTTATSYSIGDWVTDSGTTYYCLEAHTSGVFATDLAAEKWKSFSSVSNAGVQLNSHVRARCVGGIINDCYEGWSELYNCVRDFPQLVSSLGGSVAADYQLTISNCETGLLAKEGCVGHTDLITFDSCTVGMELQAYSATNPRLAHFKSCGLGVLLVNSEIHNEDTITWGTGADACTRRMMSIGNSSEINGFGWDGSPTIRVGHRPMVVFGTDYSTVTHTGTTSRTSLASWTTILPGDHYQVEGKSFAVRVVGKIPSGTTLVGDVRLLLYAAGTYMTDITIPSGISGTAPFVAEWRVTCTADGSSQHVSAWGMGDGWQDVTSIARTANLGSDATVSVDSILADASDSIAVEIAEIWA